MRLKSAWLGSAVAAAVLLAAGAGYRAAAAALEAALREPILLARPLGDLATHLGAWHGTEMELPPGALDVVRVNDHVSRRYIREGGRSEVSLYVGFSARPRSLLGHRPSVCYPTAGWVLEHSQAGTVPVGTVTVPIQEDAFRSPPPRAERRLVLSFYVVNGRLAADDGSFSGPWMRDPNLRRDARRYVAQVQIATPLKSTVSEARQVAHEFAAAALADVLALLPNTPPIEE